MISTRISRASAGLLLVGGVALLFASDVILPRLIAAMVLLKVVTRHDVSAALWFVLIPVVLFAGIYGWLLFRGPIDRDFEIHRRAQ